MLNNFFKKKIIKKKNIFNYKIKLMKIKIFFFFFFFLLQQQQQQEIKQF